MKKLRESFRIGNLEFEHSHWLLNEVAQTPSATTLTTTVTEGSTVKAVYFPNLLLVPGWNLCSTPIEINPGLIETEVEKILNDVETIRVWEWMDGTYRIAGGGWSGGSTAARNCQPLA